MCHLWTMLVKSNILFKHWFANNRCCTFLFPACLLPVPLKGGGYCIQIKSPMCKMRCSIPIEKHFGLTVITGKSPIRILKKKNNDYPKEKNHYLLVVPQKWFTPHFVCL